MLKHHSSRLSRLDQTVLNERLMGAASYDRIAGYFRSSLFEVAGEALDQITGQVRIICNSELNEEDVKTAVAAQSALRKTGALQCQKMHQPLPCHASKHFTKHLPLAKWL